MFFVLQDSTKPFFVSSSYFAWRHGRVQHLNERWSLSAFHALSSVSTVTSIRSCPGVVSIQMSAQGWKLLLLNEVHYEEMLSLEFINSLEKWQHIDEGIKMTYFKTVGHCYDFTSELRWKKKSLHLFYSYIFFPLLWEQGGEQAVLVIRVLPFVVCKRLTLRESIKIWCPSTELKVWVAHHGESEVERRLQLTVCILINPNPLWYPQGFIVLVVNVDT